MNWSDTNFGKVAKSYSWSLMFDHSCNIKTEMQRCWYLGLGGCVFLIFQLLFWCHCRCSHWNLKNLDICVAAEGVERVLGYTFILLLCNQSSPKTSKSTSQVCNIKNMYIYIIYIIYIYIHNIYIICIICSFLFAQTWWVGYLDFDSFCNLEVVFSPVSGLQVNQTLNKDSKGNEVTVAWFEECIVRSQTHVHVWT